MVREINHDMFFLSRKSSPATADDLHIADDLFDTLKANSERCVGMAANMIGELKCIIIFDDNGTYNIMFNPKIIKCADAYETTEGCLSLEGTRPVKRYKTIKVEWQTKDFKTRIKQFTGFTAQIIQHEIDHCNGVLI